MVLTKSANQTRSNISIDYWILTVCYLYLVGCAAVVTGCDFLVYMSLVFVVGVGFLCRYLSSGRYPGQEQLQKGSIVLRAKGFCLGRDRSIAPREPLRFPSGNLGRILCRQH
jgi:hypothetical protein